MLADGNLKNFTEGYWSVLTVLTLAHMMNHLYGGVVPPLLPIFRDMFTLSYSQLSLLVAMFNVGMMMQLLMGILSDRMGRRKVFAGLGLILTSTLTLTLSLAFNYPLLLLNILFLGIAASTYHPPSTTIIAEYFAEKGVEKAMGVHNIGESLGKALTSILLGIMIIYLTWQTSLIILAIPGFFVGLAYLKIVKETGWRKSSKNLGLGFGGSKSLEKLDFRKALSAIIILPVSGLTILTILDSFLVLYLVDAYNLEVSLAMLVLGLLQLSGIVGGPLGGSLAYKFGKKRTIFGSVVGQVILLILTVNLHPPLFMVISLIPVFGLLMYSFFAPALTYLSEVAPGRFKATVYSFYFTFNFGWRGFTQILTGNLINFYGFNFAFTFTAFLALTGILLILFTLKELK